jgi:hypothetical protein
MNPEERKAALEALNYFAGESGEGESGEFSHELEAVPHLNVVFRPYGYAVATGLACKRNDGAVAIIGTDMDRYTLAFEQYLDFEHLPDVKTGFLQFDLEEPSVMLPSPVHLTEVVFHHLLPRELPNDEDKKLVGIYKPSTKLLQEFEPAKNFIGILPKVKSCVFYDTQFVDFPEGESLVWSLIRGNVSINYENLTEAPLIPEPVPQSPETSQ